MSKRPLRPDFYSQKKKFSASKLSAEKGNSCSQESYQIDSACVASLPNDTEAALIYLKEKFPVEKFCGRLPCVILVHQLYSIIRSKTKVDVDVSTLKSKGTVRLFKLGGDESSHVLIFTKDYTEHVLKCCPEKPIIERFLKLLLPRVNDVGIDKESLVNEFKFTEQHISDVISAGLLTLRTASSYWFSFPNAGVFMKTYLKGRKAILRTIQKSKYSEILQSELEQRKLEKSAKLGTMFHIHDIIGAELVKCVDTTSGNLLRLEKKKKK